MGNDRRRFARAPDDRACKILSRETRRFSPGRTRNVSPGGVLVSVACPRAFAEGETVEVAIADRSRAVLSPLDLRPARVARAGPSLGQVQTLALEFLPGQDLAAA